MPGILNFVTGAVKASATAALVITAAYVVTYAASHIRGEGNAASPDIPTSQAIAPDRISEVEKSQLYQTLSLDEDHIRVLVMQPEPYEALSYHWQHLEGEEDIVVNNKRWPVSKNLAVALRALQQDSPGKSCVIWADALCINQDSGHPEKNVEVLRMRKIYSLAEKVILWLGPATNESTLVMRYFNSRAHDLMSIAQSRAEMWLEFGEHLLQRSLWTRLWVIQELVMATEAIVQCGSEKMAWPVFYKIASFAKDYDIKYYPTNSRFNVEKPLGSIHVVAALKEGIASGEELPLIYLLSLVLQYATSDKRDYIYALLGLSSDRDDINLRPNYLLDYQSVWSSVVRALVSKYGQLDMISLGRAPQRDASLPSWVPDFELAYALQAPYLPMNCMPKSLFNAAGGRDFTAHVSSNSTALIVRGFILDKITRLGRATNVHQFLGQDSRHAIKRANNVMNEAADMVLGRLRFKQYLKYPHTKESNYKACSRTLLCDIHWGEQRCVGDQGMFEDTEVVPDEFEPDTPKNLRTTMWHKRNWIWKIAHMDFRRFMLSGKHYMGMVPGEAEQDDSIVILYGASVPMILRPTGVQNEWKLIGASYVYGVMDGESVAEGSKMETLFALV